MSRSFLCTCALVTIAVLGLTGSASDQDENEKAIQAVLERSYVDGVFRKRDPDLVREGFAPTFVFQRYWNGKLGSSTLDEWLEKMKLDRVPSEKNFSAKIDVLDIAGDAAVVRLDLFEESRHKYRDYFGLYRTEQGWKIVSKLFHAMP